MLIGTNTNIYFNIFINFLLNIICIEIYYPYNEKIIINLSSDELTVENTGITIPNDQIGNIFNAFYRVDKSRNRKTGGTGLGLYIVKTILDKHENISYKILCKENSVVFKMMFKK